jgi:hypothetical protein
MKCYYMFGIFLYLQQLTPFTELGTVCMKDKKTFFMDHASIFTTIFSDHYLICLTTTSFYYLILFFCKCTITIFLHGLHYRIIKYLTCTGSIHQSSLHCRALTWCYTLNIQRYTFEREKPNKRGDCPDKAVMFHTLTLPEFSQDHHVLGSVILP